MNNYNSVQKVSNSPTYHALAFVGDKGGANDMAFTATAQPDGGIVIRSYLPDFRSLFYLLYAPPVRFMPVGDVLLGVPSGFDPKKLRHYRLTCAMRNHTYCITTSVKANAIKPLCCDFRSNIKIYSLKRTSHQLWAEKDTSGRLDQACVVMKQEKEGHRLNEHLSLFEQTYHLLSHNHGFAPKEHLSPHQSTVEALIRLTCTSLGEYAANMGIPVCYINEAGAATTFACTSKHLWGLKYAHINNWQWEYPDFWSLLNIQEYTYKQLKPNLSSNFSD